ncbi:unnamed protein product [Camellia sinensis]
MTNQIIPTTKKSKHSILEQLPTQIILEILSRFPIKTLFLCQLVSKHWLSLIPDSHFANLHLSRSPVSLLLKPFYPRRESRQLRLVDLQIAHSTHPRDAQLKFISKFNYPLLKEDKIVNSRNGLLCLSDFTDDSDPIFICNPILGEYITLPILHHHGNYDATMTAFGFSLKTNQYKVVRFFVQEVVYIDHNTQMGSYREEAEAKIYTIGGEGLWRNMGPIMIPKTGEILMLCNKDGLVLYDPKLVSITAYTRPPPSFLFLFLFLFFNQAMAGALITPAGDDSPKDYPGKLTWYVFVTCIVAAMGGLIFGYDIGISGGETDAYALWTKLEGMYQSKTARNKALLMRRLVNLKLKGGISVAEHTSEFQNLVNQLTTVKMELDDEMQALLLLSSLPDSWETLVVSLSNSAPEGKLTMSMVTDALFSEEARKKEMGGDQSHALVTENKSRGRGRGRSKSRGRSRGRSQDRGKFKDGTSRPRFKCYHCGQEGHIKKYCYALKGEQQQGNRQPKTEDGTTAVSVSEDIALFSVEEEECLHMSDNDTEWVVDTAASYHATSQKEFFSTYQAGDFGTVKMGNSSFSKIVGIGDIHIQTKVGCTMVLKDVRHVPDLRLNLISGIALDRQGYENYFGKGIWKVWVYVLKTKAEVFQHFQTFHAMVERKTEKKLKCLRTDNGGEYTSKEFKAYSIPEEVWSGREIFYSHLRVFGCKAFAHVSKEHRQKLDDKATPCIFIGYGDEEFGYRLWDPKHKKVIRSRDVVFQEGQTFEDFGQPAKPKVDDVSEIIPNPAPSQHATDEEELPQHAVNNVELQDGFLEEEDPEVEGVEQGEPQPPLPETVGPQLRRSTREFKPSTKYPTSEYILLTDEGEPESFQEAQNHKEKSSWQQSMQEEMQSLQKNQTYDLVKLPQGRKALQNKWVFKLKKDGSGKLVKYKARLVVKGFGQKKGIDFDEIFSPVVKMTSIRVVLGLAASLNLELEQMDVKTAFLHGDLKEEIYMEQPEGFEVKGKENLVCRLKKSLYGLKQAPRQWYKKFDSFMVGHEYKRTVADQCVYVRTFPGGNFIILLLYVDDMLIVGQDATTIRSLKKELLQSFDMKDLGPAQQILGMNIVRDRKAKKLWLSQEKYVERVIEKFNMKDAKPVSTPLANHFKLSKNSCPSSTKERQEMEAIPYSSAVGSVGVGFATQSVPLFVSEMAPHRYRGTLNVCFQLFITIGILIAGLVNYFTNMIKGDLGWRISLGGAAVPAVLMIFSSLWVSETPNSLIERGHLDKAKKQLQRIRGVADVQAEFNDLVDASAASKEVEHPWRDLSMRKYRPQLCLAILIPMFQQLTGINVVMFYAPVLFKTIGFQSNASLASAMITGGVNVLATFISVFGTDRWGRKPLFLWGGGMMIVFQSAVAVLIGTKFGVTGDATDLGTLYSSILYRLVLIMSLFVIFFVPETNNIPIEEMSQVWRGHWYWKKFVDDEKEIEMKNGMP